MSHLSDSFDSSKVCSITSNVACSRMKPPSQTDVAITVYCIFFLSTPLRVYQKDKLGLGRPIRM